MLNIELFYDAAAAANLLTPVQFGAQNVMVDYRAPDEDILNGMAVSREHSIRYPRSRLPELNAGDVLLIREQPFRVRELCALGDGTEMRASLMRL